MSDPLLIYGAYGYTGRLIVDHALQQGLRPILAGRDAGQLQAMANGLPTRVFSLEDPEQVAGALQGVRCVLNAAGPFSATARPMLQACLATGAHYLDITGEIDVFELAASLDEAARDAGIMLLPGVGFDVVPSDCLSAYLAQRVEQPRHLRLAILGLGGASQGTMKTGVESIDKPTRVRRDGAIVTRPPGSLTRYFDFGRGPRETVAVSWGDVATAYYSTGIPNITVYFPARGMAPMLRAGRWLGPLLTWAPVQGLLKKLVEMRPEGPDEEALENGMSIVVGEIEDESGAFTSARLTTPNGYKLTYLAAVDIAQRVLDGEWQPGFKTPSLAYGAEYVLSLPGCRLADGVEG